MQHIYLYSKKTKEGIFTNESDCPPRITVGETDDHIVIQIDDEEPEEPKPILPRFEPTLAHGITAITKKADQLMRQQEPKPLREWKYNPDGTRNLSGGKRNVLLNSIDQKYFMEIVRRFQTYIEAAMYLKIHANSLSWIMKNLDTTVRSHLITGKMSDAIQEEVYRDRQLQP